MRAHLGMVILLAACPGSSDDEFAGPARSLSLGHESTCVVDANGSLFCWGYAEVIPELEVARGELVECIDPFTPGGGFGECVTQHPVRVPTDLRFTKVSRQIAIDEDGLLWMWPYWKLAETGCNPANEVCRPTLGNPGTTMAFKDVASFDNGWCGITTDGRGYCGFEENSIDIDTRWFAPLPFAPSQTFTKIAAAGNVYVALDSEGKAWKGSLTNETVQDPVPWESDKTFTDIRIQHQSGIPSNINYPLGICGLFGSGGLFCTGPNEMGQRGTGMVDMFGTEPAPAVVTGLPSITSIGYGFQHMCATTDAGAVYCWGRSNEGQTAGTSQIECKPPELGLTHYCTPTPTLVSGLPPMKHVEASIQWTCGLANDDSVWCWGLNNSAQLGEAGAARGPIKVL